MPANRTGIDLKIERAKKHLRDLDALFIAFGKTDPYKVVLKKNPDTGQREHTVTKLHPVPPDVSTITGDVIHNLRAALDHLIWQLVIADGGKPEENPDAYAFPIWDAKAKYESGFPGKAKGVSKPALKRLRRLQPYKGGNGDALWRIHYLDIVDKHRLLLTVNAAQTGITFVGDHVLWDKADPNAPPEFVHASPEAPVKYAKRDPTPVKVGSVLATFAAKDKSHDDTEFAVTVSLNEPAIGGLEPLFPALKQLIDFTAGVVTLFDAELS